MATEYGGYMGKILWIDLTTETAEEYPLTDRQRRETLGGKALAYRILAERLTGKEKAFSEENLLILSTGPLSGAGAPGSGRFEITTISPQSALPVSSNCGGNFGVFLKKAGFDGLILWGQCTAPRWLDISETGVRFRDADDLWGAGTAGCIQYLTQQCSCNPWGYLCIGPAGEELLPSAAIISGGRSVGKAGFGAILGWKKLKAVTVSGRNPVPLRDPNDTMEEIKRWTEQILRNPITSNPDKESSCPGCPIRCNKKEALTDPVLIDLGLDPVDAPRYMTWLREKLGRIPELSVPHKHGKRRGELYRAMLQMLELSDCESSYDFYMNLTEAIGALGLCIFTVGASFAEPDPRCLPEDPAASNVSMFPVSVLQYITGLSISLETLLTVGKESRRLQNQLCDSFQNRETDPCPPVK